MIEKEDKVLLGFSIVQCVVCFSILTYVLYKNKCKFNAVLIIFFSVYSLVFLLMLSTQAFIVIHRNNDNNSSSVSNLQIQCHVVGCTTIVVNSSDSVVVVNIAATIMDCTCVGIHGFRSSRIHACIFAFGHWCMCVCTCKHKYEYTT